jgi:aryl-alcohol dehydrogenase-like predicted oxidoreductase
MLLVQGCWQLAGGHGRDVFDGVQVRFARGFARCGHAIMTCPRLQEKLAAHAEAGFTTFDTADIYGPSERMPYALPLRPV